MRAHLEAVQAALAVLGRDVYLVDAPTTHEGELTRVPTPPYYVVAPGSSRTPGAVLDLSLEDLTGTVGVTAVGVTVGAALSLGASARAVLAPGAAPCELLVPQRRAWLTHLGTDDIDVDRTVVAHVPNRHPAYRRDTYRLDSVPA